MRKKIGWIGLGRMGEAKKTMWVGEGELARIWKIARNTMFGLNIQNPCEITVLAEKAGIPRNVFLESINDSVLGSMHTRYKAPVLRNLNWELVTFTSKLVTACTTWPPRKARSSLGAALRED